MATKQSGKWGGDEFPDADIEGGYVCEVDYGDNPLYDPLDDDEIECEIEEDYAPDPPDEEDSSLEDDEDEDWEDEDSYWDDL